MTKEEIDDMISKYTNSTSKEMHCSFGGERHMHCKYKILDKTSIEYCSITEEKQAK